MILKTTVGAALIASAAWFSFQPTTNNPAFAATEVVTPTLRVGTAIGDLAPEIALNNPKGKQMKLSDLRGQLVLIDFWASWCAPCRLEHPFLLKLNSETKLNILGVNFKDKKNNAINFLNSYGNPYDELVRDDLGKKSVNFGVYGIPESILVNKDLIIIKKFIGPLSNEDYKIIQKIIK